MPSYTRHAANGLSKKPKAKHPVFAIVGERTVVIERRWPPTQAFLDRYKKDVS